MKTINNYLSKLIRKIDFSSSESEELLTLLTDSQTLPTQIAGVLAALTTKGETIDEITGLIAGMRKNMLTISSPLNAMDVCGTGGDGKGTFNISTATAFVVAGAGVPVIKHGNRAASSKSGSADVLEALGVTITLTPDQAQDVLKKVGMVFLFAPLFHPSMKAVSLVRKDLKIPTVFNLLGPFANPGKVTNQLIGVPSTAVAEKLIEVGKKLGYHRLALVVSDDGMDEISSHVLSTMYVLTEGKVTKETIDPKLFNFTASAPSDLFGGDAFENARSLTAVLEGQKGAKRDTVVLNAAAALRVAGKAATMEEGISLAESVLDSGKAKMILVELQKETKKYA